MNGSIRNVHYTHYQDTRDSFNKSPENERQIKHLIEEIMVNLYILFLIVLRCYPVKTDV